MANSNLTDFRETWKPIAGFEDYEASDMGHVRRARDHKILGQHQQRGYHAVKLNKTRMGTSRAVCRAFYGPPPSPEHYALHNNGDPQDNRAVNLRWGTQKENCEDKVLHGTMASGVKNGFAKLTEESILEIRRLCKPGRNSGGMRQRDVAAMFGIHQGAVSFIVSRQTWDHVPPE